VIKIISLVLLLCLVQPGFSENVVNNVVDKGVVTTTLPPPQIAIAVVNVRYLLQHAPQSEAARKALKQRFISKEKLLDAEAEAIRKFEASVRLIDDQLDRTEKIEKERELRSRKRAQNRALEDYREDLRLAKNAALDDVQKVVFEAIDVVRKSRNIDIVIQDFVAASERVDITKTVLSYLANKLKEDKKNTDK
jgi:Skp family chaperone for outer membrane proteins